MLFLIKQIVWIWQQKKSQRQRGTEAKKHIYSSTEAKRHRGKEAHLQQHRGKEAQRQRSTEAQRQRSTEAKTLRTSFSSTVELLLIGSPRFDQTHGYGDRIIFGDTFDRVILLVTLFHRSIDQAILLVTLFHRSIDRAILLVTLLRRLRLPKINFGTFQLGIVQLGPRVLGSPSPPLPPPPPPKKSRKKNFRKNFKFPLPPPLLIGNRRERSKKVSRLNVPIAITERVPAGHKTSQ